MTPSPRSSSSSRELRVLVVAPTAREATMTVSILVDAGVGASSCATLQDACEELERGAAALLVPEELLAGDETGCLSALIGRQPPWSDIPILLVARSGADSADVLQAIDRFANVTVLERPIRLAALVSVVRSAIRARQRQYQIRDHLEQREREFQTRALLAAIVESSDDAIISKDLDGNIVTWNAGAERVFGYKAEEVVGRSITILFPPDRVQEEVRMLERLRRGDRIDHFETTRVAKNGRPIDLSISISPIHDSAGRVIGASKVARDITQRKQAEEALRDADRRKDEFLAILAHELRNPLAPIRNSLHLLRLSGQRDPTIKRLGEMIERQVNHLVRLVDDLLEVSRITRGKLELRIERVDVASFVRGAVETSRPLIEAGRHSLSVAIPDEPLAVDGDPVRLTQVVANLLNNAAKYTDPGGQLWLTARREARSVVISVRDTGAGFSAHLLPKAFELFAQVDRRPSRIQEGLGIGLTLVKSLVEMHGGSVAAVSEGEGRGSEFIVRLPLALIPAVETAEPPGDMLPRPLPGRRVLVVDDNRDAAESLGMLLQFLGADVQVAFSGAEALELVRTYRPVAVLLDIGMPGMDGHDVARRIRAEPDLASVTLIALTGWGQEEDRRRSRAAGFDYHLIKPADLTALETLLLSIESRDHPGSDSRIMQDVEAGNVHDH